MQTKMLINEELVAGAALLLKTAQVIEAHQDKLAESGTLDVGKPWPSARDDEFPLTFDTFRLFAGTARTMMGSAAGAYVAGHNSMIRHIKVAH